MTEENNFLLVRERHSELVIRVSGTWRLQDGLPSMDAIKKEIERPPHAKSVLFDTRELAGWDSSMVWFLSKASELCRESGIAVDRGRLPKGLRRLVDLAEVVPEKKGAEAKTIIAKGNPRELLAHSRDPRVHRFLSPREEARL